VEDPHLQEFLVNNMPSPQMISFGKDKIQEKLLLLGLVILHWNVEDSFMG